MTSAKPIFPLPKFSTTVEWAAKKGKNQLLSVLKNGKAFKWANVAMKTSLPSICMALNSSILRVMPLWSSHCCHSGFASMSLRSMICESVSLSLSMMSGRIFMMLGIRSLRTRSFTFSVLRERANCTWMLHTSRLKSGVSSRAARRIWMALDVEVRFLWASRTSIAHVKARNCTWASSERE